MSVENLLGQDRGASLKTMVAQWKKEKNELLEQLAQVRKEQNLHSHKRRDPTEANFKLLWKEGQVESVGKSLSRRQSLAGENDWLDRYTIAFKSGPQGEQYAPWIVHAHFDSPAANAAPIRVHMKRDAEKD